MAKSARWKVIAGLGVACATCCVPLLLPLIGVAGGTGVATVAAGGLFGRSWAQLACDAVLAVLIVSGVFLVLRARADRKRAIACACAPDTTNGGRCEVGGTCDPNTSR